MSCDGTGTDVKYVTGDSLSTDENDSYGDYSSSVLSLGVDLVSGQDQTIPVSMQSLSLSIKGETLLASKTLCYGHDTSVDEDDIKDLADGSGTAAVSGSGDSELATFTDGEYWESETNYYGNGDYQIELNKYLGSDASAFTIKCKTGATEAACNGAGWTEASSFTSLGWARVRVEFNL